MQLGPMTRMPASTARRTICASSSASSSSPVSLKPAVKKWIERTPLAMQSSTRGATTRAGGGAAELLGGDDEAGANAAEAGLWGRGAGDGDGAGVEEEIEAAARLA